MSNNTPEFFLLNEILINVRKVIYVKSRTVVNNENESVDGIELLMEGDKYIASTVTMNEFIEKVKKIHE